MIRIFRLLALFALSAAASLLPAHADTLYTQPQDNSGFAYISTTNTNASQPQLGLDNFTLNMGATISSLEWQGFYAENYGPTEDMFTIAFFSDDNGAPGTLLSSEEVDFIGLPDAGLQELDFLTDLTPFSAGANTAYWLEIASSDANFAWLTGDGGGGDGMLYLVNNSDPSDRSLQADDFAFTLYGDPAVTPEPSGLVLLGTGALSLAAVARRRLCRL